MTAKLAIAYYEQDLVARSIGIPTTDLKNQAHSMSETQSRAAVLAYVTLEIHFLIQKLRPNRPVSCYQFSMNRGDQSSQHAVFQLA